MKEITINGKATPIHFGMRAVAEFTKRQESDFAENITTTAAVGSIDSIVALTEVGLNEGARRSGSERRYAEDDVWGPLRRRTASGAGGLATLRREHLAAD